MSDPITALFDGLRDDEPPAPFAPAGQVRERGRRRRRRSHLAVAATVVALVVAGAGWAASAAGPDRAPAPPGHAATLDRVAPTTAGPTPAGRPETRTAVPANALLTPADLGPDWRAEPVDDLGPGGPGWPWDRRDCPRYRKVDYPSLRTRGAARVLVFVHSGGSLAEQVVERHGQPEANVADIVRVTTFCGTYRATGGKVYGSTSGMDFVLETVDTGIAGDQSLLLRETTTYLEGKPLRPARPAVIAYHVVIRGGDLVTTVTLRTDDEQFVRRVAERAAKRLA